MDEHLFCFGTEFCSLLTSNSAKTTELKKRFWHVKEWRWAMGVSHVEQCVDIRWAHSLNSNKLMWCDPAVHYSLRVLFHFSTDFDNLKVRNRCPNFSVHNCKVRSYDLNLAVRPYHPNFAVFSKSGNCKVRPKNQCKSDVRTSQFRLYRTIMKSRKIIIVTRIVFITYIDPGAKKFFSQD